MVGTWGPLLRLRLPEVELSNRCHFDEMKLVCAQCGD
jgi:hypothetical protein